MKYLRNRKGEIWRLLPLAAGSKDKQPIHPFIHYYPLSVSRDNSEPCKQTPTAIREIISENIIMLKNKMTATLPDLIVWPKPSPVLSYNLYFALSPWRRDLSLNENHKNDCTTMSGLLYSLATKVVHIIIRINTATEENTEWNEIFTIFSFD
jgi:hypothetical protein